MRAACQGLLATGPLGLSPSLTITTQASTALRSQAAMLWAAARAQELTAYRLRGLAYSYIMCNSTALCTQSLLAVL